MSLPRITAITVLAAQALFSAPGAGAQRGPCRAQLSVPDAALDPAERLRSLRAAPNGAQDLLRESAGCDERGARTGAKAAKPAKPAKPAKAAKRLSFFGPDLRMVWNDRIPDSRNDGALWAGRGASALVRLGVLVDYGPLHATLVPELWWAQNRAFDFFPAAAASGRSSFASPFYSGAIPLDFPSRMGADPITEFSPGQSAVWLDLGPLAAGWSSANQQWGSGREGLLLGNSAAGVPRAFVRTSRPVATAAGRWSASWFLGRLTESRWFDYTPANDARSLTTIAVGWSPPASDLFAVSLARAVMRPLPRDGSASRDIGAAFIPLRPADGDEIVSFSARLHAAEARVRAWIEIAHAGPLRLRDLITAPNAGIAYRVGVERAVEYPGGAWNFLFEAANLEMPADFLDRPSHDFYSGWGTPQGWTQRGQLLGDGIGPGGQSQFFSADWVAPRWLAGGFAERVRWNEDAMFREYLPYPNRHDVSLRVGARGGLTIPGWRALAEFSWGTRLNYLFQNSEYIPAYRTVDVPLTQLKLTLTPSESRTP